MKCETTDRAVKELYEQCAGPEAHRVLQEHLAACPDCRKKHSDTFGLLESIYAIELPYPPADMTYAIMSEIHRSGGLSKSSADYATKAPGRVLRLDARAESGKAQPGFSYVRPAGPQFPDQRTQDSAPCVLPFHTQETADNVSASENSFFRRAGLRTMAAAAAAVLVIVMFRGLSVDNGKMTSAAPQGSEVAQTNDSFDPVACRVYNFSGTFQHHDGLRWNPGSISTQISDGARIKVGKGSYVTLHAGTVATYLFGPDSLITVHGDSRRISLDAGTVSETVNPGNGTFSVITPLGTVTVVGTMFDVKVSENGEAAVAVREGLVSVRDRRGIARLISKGQSISIKESGIAEKPENVTLLRPMQEIFIPNVFGTAPNSGAIVPVSKGNQQNELPEAVRKPVILEKDMKEAKTLMDFLW